MRGTSRGIAVASRTARVTSGPMVMEGTKCPSITSTWIQSAPAAVTAATSSEMRPKSAERMEGAISGIAISTSGGARSPPGGSAGAQANREEGVQVVAMRPGAQHAIACGEVGWHRRSDRLDDETAMCRQERADDIVGLCAHGRADGVDEKAARPDQRRHGRHQPAL